MEREQLFPLPGEDFMHYSRERNTLHVFDGPNAYHHRKMFLYGRFIQFHSKLKTKNQYLGKEWFITGMGDALSTHRWDGERLELAASLLLDSDNRASRAIQSGLLEKLASRDLSIDDMDDWVRGNRLVLTPQWGGWDERGSGHGGHSPRAWHAAHRLGLFAEGLQGVFEGVVLE